MKSVNRIFLLIVLILFCGSAFTQLSYNLIHTIQLDASVCWNVKIQVAGTGERVVLTGKISDENGKVLIACESEPVILRNGLNALDALQVKTEKITFYDERVRKHLEHHGILPPGRYQFCTEAKTKRDRETIGEDCITLTQSEDAKATPRGKVKIPPHIQFYGTASVEHIYSTRQGTNQIVPPHLVRVQAQPGMSIYNIPIGLNLYYTTERNRQWPNPFAATLLFDAHKFRDNLRRMVEEKLTEITHIQTGTFKQRYEQLTELGNIYDRLKNIKVNPDEIKALENKIRSAEFVNIDNDMAELNQISALELEKIDYEKLKYAYTQAHNELTGYIPADSAEEVQKKILFDSIESRLAQLEARKDSLLSRVRKYNSKLNNLLEKKRQYDELMARLQELKSAAEEAKNLTERKQYLETLQNNLKTWNQVKYDELTRLYDPVVLKQHLMERGYFTGLNKLFYGVRQLQIGTVYPFYSPLTLSGIQVQGGMVEINPGLFFLNISGGNAHLGAVNFTDIFRSAYQRWMIGAKTGLGKPERSHFYISYLHLFDNKNTLPDVLTPVIRPQQNDVLGVEAQAAFWKGKVKLTGEGVTAAFNRSRNDSALVVPNEWYERIPEFLRPNLSTSYDFAYMARGEFQMWKGSNIIAFTEYIGPGYVTFGVPFLRNDVIRYGGRMEQHFRKSNLKLTARYRYELDNLIRSKRFASPTHIFGAGFSWNKQRFPSLRLDYNGNYRTNQINTTWVHGALFNIAYNYKVADMRWRTGVSYQFMWSQSDSITLGDYTLHNSLLTQQFSFRFPLTLMFTMGYNQNHSNSFINRQVQFGSGAFGTPFKNFTAAWNIDVAKNLERETRLGSSVDLSYTLFNHLTLSTNFRYNKYVSFFSTDFSFNELVITSRLNVRW
ncbi:MAG: hypothetical protein NZM35_01770 [Chitinophagales bacterium]|nr:hypothetical protein [Chitinophagales bacterium]MDW8418426.1 hypothetical protein [Chitinophagales bacterium]